MGDYLCNEDSLRILRTSVRTIVILKKKPALSKSRQTAGQVAEIGSNLFERCIFTLLLLREKRVVLSPMLERTAICGK